MNLYHSPVHNVCLALVSLSSEIKHTHGDCRPYTKTCRTTLSLSLPLPHYTPSVFGCSWQKTHSKRHTPKDTLHTLSVFRCLLSFPLLPAPPSPPISLSRPSCLLSLSVCVSLSLPLSLSLSLYLSMSLCVCIFLSAVCACVCVCVCLSFNLKMCAHECVCV